MFLVVIIAWWLVCNFDFLSSFAYLLGWFSLGVSYVVLVFCRVCWMIWWLCLAV